MPPAKALAGLSRNTRQSSPRADEFYTGVSDINPDEALHSTQQFNNTDREQWEPHWNRYIEARRAESEGSASMSIELGRGVKRAGDAIDDNISSSAVFTFGDKDEWEITGTPPIKNLSPQRKSDGNMRREVSIRRANAGAKRTVSHNAGTAGLDRDDTTGDLRDAIKTRSTRFGPGKNAAPAPAPAPALGTPHPASQTANPVTGDTATSFVLPDVSNIRDLIDPVQKDITSQAVHKSRSRFTPSASHRMPLRFSDVERLPVQSVPIPEDEKQIYAALQSLQKQLAESQANHARAERQLAEREDENTSLRKALARKEQSRRPASASASEDDTTQETWQHNRTKMQSNMRSLQQCFEKSEHKLSARNNELKARTKEKDDLAALLRVERLRTQELESENADLQHNQDGLEKEVVVLRREVQRLQTSTKDSVKQPANAQNTTNKLNRQSQPTAKANKVRDHEFDFENLDDDARRGLANAALRYLQNQTQQQDANVTNGQSVRSGMFDLETRPVRNQRSTVNGKGRNGHADEEEAFTEFEVTNTRNLSAAFTQQDAADQDTGDVTNLTAADPLQVSKLRQMLEEQRRDRHSKRHSSTPALPSQTAKQNTTERRSSLRGPLAQEGSQAPAKAARTVRVQSPSAADETGDVTEDADQSQYRPASRDGGETSAFIIPDITLHRRNSRVDATINHDHDKPGCTVCNSTTRDAPALVPISVRAEIDEDVTTRPSQPPQLALAMVLKQLNDELQHVKLALARYQKEHIANEPATGARDRKRLYDNITSLMADCRRKEDQIYALYDSLEGQIGVHEQKHGQPKNDVKNQASSDKTQKAPQRTSGLGLDGAFDMDGDDYSVGLPAWEGLSDDGM